MLQSVNDYIEADLVHSIHTSERRSFRGCRRRHDWIFRHRYYPTVTPKPLEFGVAYHKAMEVYYDPRTWHDKFTAANLALVAFRNTVQDQRNAFERLNGFMDPAVKDDYDERVELGLGMLNYYFKWVSPRLDTSFKPVKVEISFEVPIKSPDGEQLWCNCDICWQTWRNSSQGAEHHDSTCTDHPLPEVCGYRAGWQGLPVTYGGRIDMLAENDEGYWVFDWKTAARLSGVDQGTEDDFLLLDDQITSYCWALWVLGIDVKGFIYHEQKKAFPQEPEPLKRPRLNAMYSTNKQFPTTYEMYHKTVSENDPYGLQVGAYDNYLEWLRTEGFKFESRRQVHRNETELLKCGEYIYNEACDIIDPNLRIYPSPGRFACGFCAFQQPCLGVNRGEDYLWTLETNYDKRDRHYWQTQPSSSDKPGRG